MDENELFLSTNDDLRDRLNRGDAYSLLKATGLLRQLLLDASPLAHRVNRAHRLKLCFEVPCAPEDWDAWWGVVERIGAEFAAAGDLLHKSASANQHIQELSLDDFLAFRVVRRGDRHFTVGELISHGANVAGGIHSGAARTEQERALSQFHDIVLAGKKGMYPPIFQVRSIIRVTLDALEPLRQAVAAPTRDPKEERA